MFEYTAQYYHNGVWSMMVGAPVTGNKEIIKRWIARQKKQARKCGDTFWSKMRVVRRPVLDWEPIDN